MAGKIPRVWAYTPVHQPRTDLGELAADMGVDRIAQQGSFRLRRQRNLRAAPGKTRQAALPLKLQGIGARRIHIG